MLGKLQRLHIAFGIATKATDVLDAHVPSSCGCSPITNYTLATRLGSVDVAVVPCRARHPCSLFYFTHGSRLGESVQVLDCTHLPVSFLFLCHHIYSFRLLRFWTWPTGWRSPKAVDTHIKKWERKLVAPGCPDQQESIATSQGGHQKQGFHIGRQAGFPSCIALGNEARHFLYAICTASFELTNNCSETTRAS